MKKEKDEFADFIKELAPELLEEPKEQKKEYKGVWIPKQVWDNPNISLQKKCFLVEINSLDNEEGCWAGNEHFAKFFGISTRRVRQIISELEEDGYISREVKRKKGSYNVEKRILRIKTALFKG